MNETQQPDNNGKGFTEDEIRQKSKELFEKNFVTLDYNQLSEFELLIVHRLTKVFLTRTAELAKQVEELTQTRDELVESGQSLSVEIKKLIGEKDHLQQQLTIEQRKVDECIKRIRYLRNNYLSTVGIAVADEFLQSIPNTSSNLVEEKPYQKRVNKAFQSIIETNQPQTDKEK